jgi:hypothetical protein
VCVCVCEQGSVQDVSYDGSDLKYGLYM